MSLRERNNKARLKVHYRNQLEKLCPDQPRDMFSTLKELKQKVEAERRKRAPPVEYQQEQLNEFYTYKKLLEKEENKERREKSGLLIHDKGGEVVSVADPSPYIWDDGLWAIEDYNEMKRQREEEKEKSPWRFCHMTSINEIN